VRLKVSKVGQSHPERPREWRLIEVSFAVT
jgi:hypothetical protein